MKLLLENWRKYLNENENNNSSRLLLEELSQDLDFPEFLRLLNKQRGDSVEDLDKGGEDLEERLSVPKLNRDPNLPVGTIYCDMDGVLADFPGGLLNLLHDDLKSVEAIKAMANFAVGVVGKFEYYLKMLKSELKGLSSGRQDPKKLVDLEKAAEEYFNGTGDPHSDPPGRLKKGWERFFKFLPPTPGGLELWKEIGPYGVTLLTGAPGGKGVLYAKLLWVKENLYPPPQHIIKQSFKGAYAFDENLDKPNLLIDDWTHNIEAWEKSGGEAVQFNEKNPQATLSAVKMALQGKPGGPHHPEVKDL